MMGHCGRRSELAADVFAPLLRWYVVQVSTHAADARQVLDERRVADALDALLKLWRDRRDARIALAIKALGALCDAVLPALEAVEGRDGFFASLHDAWIDLAAEQRSVDLGRLLDALRRAHAATFSERLARLETWPADPRIADALVMMVTNSWRSYSSRSKRKVWAQVAALLLRHGDCRTDAALEPVRAALARSRKRGGDHAELVGKKLDGLGGKLPAPRPLDAAEQAALEAVEGWIADHAQQAREGAWTLPTEALELEAQPQASASARCAEQLLDEIRADPSDTELRRVYADLLAEAGEPWGELITLQCQGPTPKGDKRIKDLLSEHRRRWLGELDPVIEAKSCVFERGFLAAAYVRCRTAKQLETLGGSPGWSTLDQLAGRDAPRLLAEARMPALRTLGMVVRVGGALGAGAQRYELLRRRGGLDDRALSALLGGLEGAGGEHLAAITSLQLTLEANEWALLRVEQLVEAQAMPAVEAVELRPTARKGVTAARLAGWDMAPAMTLLSR